MTDFRQRWSARPRNTGGVHLDDQACYRAVASRDRRFDGVFFTGVRTTGIYCRPSCPARTPHPANVTFFRSAAAAQRAGFRACRRCVPDATPGTPGWDVTADVARRAAFLIADGMADRVGVGGLAAAVGYSVRQLNRILLTEYGAGAAALARAHRAQGARLLIEESALPLGDIAFAAGFGSVRQFNDTVKEVYGTTPSGLRGRPRGASGSGALSVRIPIREPFDGGALLGFLADRAVPGVEAAGPTWYERSLRLPHGHGVVRLELLERAVGVIPMRLTLADLRDLAPAMARTRRLVDAECDPVAVDEALSTDPLLRPLVCAHPGLRVPGHVDGDEIAVRAVIGQQVSVAAARTVAGRLAAEYGERVVLPGSHNVGLVFPRAEVLAGLDRESLPMPRARADALIGLSGVLARGEVRLDRSQEPDAVRDGLLAVPGIGPWTADYISMRALGDPDAFLPTDLGVGRAAARLGVRDVAARAERWRPWRSYALMHLWFAES